jgi:hypothetical protein
MLEIIADYATTPGTAIDAAIIHAWPAFDIDEFLEKVIRRRQSLYGLSIANLSDERLQCLSLLVDYDNAVPQLIFKRLEAFSSRQELVLRLMEMFQA